MRRKYLTSLPGLDRDLCFPPSHPSSLETMLRCLCCSPTAPSWFILQRMPPSQRERSTSNTTSCRVSCVDDDFPLLLVGAGAAFILRSRLHSFNTTKSFHC